MKKPTCSTSSTTAIPAPQVLEVRPRRATRLMAGVPGPNEFQTVHFEGSWNSRGHLHPHLPELRNDRLDPMEQRSSRPPGQHQSGARIQVRRHLLSRKRTIQSGRRIRRDVRRTNVPKMTCTKVAGAGTCEITTEKDGAPGTNVIHVTCGEGCSQLAVDNSGRPNQGVIYIGSRNQGRTRQCLPSRRNLRWPDHKHPRRPDIRQRGAVRCCGRRRRQPLHNPYGRPDPLHIRRPLRATGMVHPSISRRFPRRGRSGHSISTAHAVRRSIRASRW